MKQLRTRGKESRATLDMSERLRVDTKGVGQELRILVSPADIRGHVFIGF